MGSPTVLHSPSLSNFSIRNKTANNVIENIDALCSTVECWLLRHRNSRSIVTKKSQLLSNKKSPTSLLNQTSLQAAEIVAIYSAFEVDKATNSYFFELHESALSITNIACVVTISKVNSCEICYLRIPNSMIYCPCDISQ